MDGEIIEEEVESRELGHTYQSTVRLFASVRYPLSTSPTFISRTMDTGKSLLVRFFPLFLQ